MQRIFLLFLLTFLLSISLFAQVVPNASFENWTNGNPDGWTAVTNLPPLYSNISKSTTAHSGSASARGDVTTYLSETIGPLMITGTGTNGFAIAQRYASFTGFYQFNSVNGDQFTLECALFKGTAAIATATSRLGAASTWTQFSSNFTYFTNDTPDKAIITVLVNYTSGTGVNVGSFFLLDDLDLTGTATSINDGNIIPAKFALEQNYPNPFNPSTKIKYDLADNVFVSLKIYNAIGGEVASLINSVVPAGSHEIVFDAAALKSGVYFYTITAGTFVQTRKMILMK
jgi:hypothetical protein